MIQAKKKLIGWILLGAVLLAGVLGTGGAVYTWTQKTGKDFRYTVVIDPGHGGIDPGKIGVNDVLEKDINLSISAQLKEILEQNDCKVLMTREADEGLYQPGDSNKKISDLRARCEMINESEADIVISIHQNSFTSPSSKGAQVFYQASSEEGKKLADCLQAQLVSVLDPENRRVAKANNDYYMLKHTEKTMVIAECGFLSNPEEADRLTDGTYQRRVAWAVALGALQYLSAVSRPPLE